MEINMKIENTDKSGDLLMVKSGKGTNEAIFIIKNDRYSICFMHDKPFYIRWWRVLSLIITGKCNGD